MTATVAPLHWLQPGPSRADTLGRVAYSARSRVSSWGLAHLGWLARFEARVTVRDLFPGAGDTLITGIICRHVKERWPGLRLNCITRNPDLLLHDPHLAELNGPPGRFVLDAWYLDLVERRDNVTNVVAPTLAAIGVHDVDYRARVYLTEDERRWAADRLRDVSRPRIAVSLLSAVPAKNWPLQHWRVALAALGERGSIVHLGDSREPDLPNASRWAGACSRRESMALLSQCDVFIGPVSFLMHAANGLDVPSVITYGGQHSPAVSGYAGNRNLYVDMPCSGCWLTGDPGDECPHALACQDAIAPADVVNHVAELLNR